MEPKELFQKAYELIKDEKCWTVYYNARDKDGDVVSADDPIAVCWCSNGALNKFNSFFMHPNSWVRGALNETARQHGVNHFLVFNDTHTHAEVMAMWEETGEREGWL